eukprot:scaffold163831_cov22-Prasinocladus_malaysianus.AAC.1
MITFIRPQPVPVVETCNDNIMQQRQQASTTEDDCKIPEMSSRIALCKAAVQRFLSGTALFTASNLRQPVPYQYLSL